MYWMECMYWMKCMYWTGCMYRTGGMYRTGCMYWYQENLVCTRWLVQCGFIVSSLPIAAGLLLAHCPLLRVYC
jgi:hypothetical protein